MAPTLDSGRGDHRRSWLLTLNVACWAVLAAVLFYVLHTHLQTGMALSIFLGVSCSFFLVEIAAIGLRATVNQRDVVAENRRGEDEAAVDPTRYLQSLESVTDPALGLLPVEKLLDLLLERALEGVGGDVISILLISSDGKGLYVRAGCGDPSLKPNGSTLTIGDGILGDVAQWTRPIVIEDLQDVAPPATADSRGLASLVAAPLLSHGAAIGVIEVGSKTPRRFGQTDVRLLQVTAERCGNAIEHRAAQ